MAWSWWDAVVVWVLDLVIDGLVVGARGGVMTLATLALTVATTPLVALLWLVARARGAALAVFGDAAPLPSLLRGLVEGALAFLVLNILVTAPLVVLFDIPDVQEQLRAVALADGLTPLAALTLVVVTPLGEEVLYRGLLYRGLRNRLATWPAIALSGAVFGVVHVEPLAILVTGLLGAELAWLLERRRSLLAPLAAHATFNAIGLVLLASA